MRYTVATVISITLVIIFTLFTPGSHAQSATLGSWQESAQIPGTDNGQRTHQFPSFAVDGRYYVHTEGSDGLVLYVADQQADGSLGSWRVANGAIGGFQGFTAVVADGKAYHFRNGHIARYDFEVDGTMSGGETLLESSPSEAFGGYLWFWDSAVYAPLTSGSYIIHLGGFNCPPGTGCPQPKGHHGNIYLSSLPLSQGASFTDSGSKHPGNQTGKSAFYVPNGSSSYGFIYTTENNGSQVWMSRFESGVLSAWETVGTFPAGTGNNRGDMFVIGDALYVIRGSAVWKADIDPSTGVLSAWDDSPPDLPRDQIDVQWGGELEGATFGIIGNHVYVTGSDRVYFARFQGDTSPSPTVTPDPSLSTTIAPTTSASTCEDKKRNGDYNCDDAIGDADFVDWKADFVKGTTDISFFEYWRRASAN